MPTLEIWDGQAINTARPAGSVSSRQLQSRRAAWRLHRRHGERLSVQSQDLRVYIVRHGQTAWSLSGQHTGRTDIPLTEIGEAEAKALAPWLRGIHFGHVLTSPLRRARGTC
jgi:broad specificity phosphatase PhoE